MSPAIFGSAPKIALAVSVRPLPTSPATPTISPRPTENETAGPAVAPQVHDPQRFARDRRIGAEDALVGECPPDHHPHDLRDRKSGERAGRDELAVAQHRHPVADLADLLKAVGDKEDRHAARFETPQDFEQALGFLGSEGRSRLVENEELALEGEGLGDFDELHLRHAEARDLCGRLDVEPDLREQLGRPPVRLAIIDDAAALRQTLEHQVLGDRHLGQHRELLMHDPDAGAKGVGRGARGVGCAVEDDLALVDGIDAAEQVDERRLARPVLPEEHMALAAPDLERDAAERDDAGKALPDVGHGEDGRAHGDWRTCGEIASLPTGSPRPPFAFAIRYSATSGPSPRSA